MPLHKACFPPAVLEHWPPRLRQRFDSCLQTSAGLLRNPVGVLTGSPVEANELVRRAGGKACLVAGSNAAVLQHALVKVWKVTIKDACGLLVLQIAVLWDGTGSAQGRIDRVSD